MGNKVLLKRLLSFMLAIMLILPPVSEVSMAVVNAAENVTSNEKVYEHDGYIVVYKVTSEWEGHKAIEVTLKNTGTKNITNWALAIDNTGDITGLWNTVLSATDLNKHTVKCMDYNNTIQAGQSVTFGYTLKGTDLSVPDDISMCVVESVLSEGFDVAYKVTGDWGTGFQGEIKIVNESEVAIEGWKLNFKGNFDVLNYWNCELTENADGTYTITHTSWQNSITSGGEYVIGFVGSKTDNEMVISDVEMIVTGCGAGSGENETDPTSPSEPETSSAVPTEPVTEPSTEVPTEPETSAVAPTEPTTPSETKPTETEPTTAAPEINWEDETDTDGDGLPDVYEIHTFGTNPENADTDGDNLPDGYELLNLGTDQTKVDSDGNGITDDKEDADNDGLDNLTEYQLGTNPTNADGDYDGLNDKEEIENYGTDPSDSDTDYDGIGDGDELKLGLNPLNPSTNGVPDGQYTIKQTIAADSKVLEDVNTSTENPFELSLNVSAAGLAEKNLTVQGTTENAMFQNESYVGELITIDYKDTMGFESIQISFAMDEAVLENELDLFGDKTTELKEIRRFNVFKFVEEVNMLLPIETFHDEETNTVYTVTDDDGMYYLVDMEKWLYGLQQLNADEEAQVMSLSLDGELSTEITSDNVETDVTTVQNQAGEGITEELKEEMSAIAEMIESGNMPATMSLYDDMLNQEVTASSKPIDLVLVFQLYNLWEQDDSTMIVNAIKVWTGTLMQKYDNLRVCVLCRVTDDYQIFLGSNDYYPEWFNSFSEMEGHVPWQHQFRQGDEYLVREYFDGLLSQDVMGYREEAAKFIFDIQLGNNIVDYFYFSDCMKLMKEQGIIYSELHNIDNAYLEHTELMRNTIEMTGGKMFSLQSNHYLWDIPNYVDDFMNGYVVPQTKFNAVLATGYKKITLDAPLASGSGTDTDEDTITDWDEVYTEMLTWDASGKVILPSLKYCIDNASEKSYVVDGLSRFKADNTPAGMPSGIYEMFMEKLLESTYVLPIHSSPVDIDGDCDRIKDIYDVNDLKIDVLGEKYIELIDKECITMESLVSTDDGFTICMTPLSEIFYKLGFLDYNIPKYEAKTIEYYFDDWYIYSVDDGADIVYSIMQLREREMDKYSTVSIPFIKFNMNLIEKYCANNDYIALGNEIEAVTEGSRLSHDSILSGYFKNDNAEALYLLSELYIKKIIESEIDESLILAVDNYSTYKPCEYAMKTLEKYSIKQSENEQIYDPENNIIHIMNNGELSLAEKQCILAIRSCNPSFNSFAAEIVYHAQKTYDEGYIFGLGYEQAIKADMGIGEEPYGWISELYKGYDGEYVARQRRIFGDK